MTKRFAILIGLLLQTAAVFAVLIPSAARLRAGMTVTLRTVPVDPRSILRGDYVILDYEIGQFSSPDWSYGKPVYVVLEPDGEVSRHVRVYDGVPEMLAPGQTCIRGIAEYDRIVFRDIAQYFVPEGEGRELERDRNAHRLLVDVALDSSCRAVIRGIRLEPEASGPLAPASAPSVSPPPAGGTTLP